MATKAERFRHDAERAGPKLAPKPRLPRRDSPVNTALPHVSATDRKAALPRRPSKAADRKAIYVLEDSATRPSRRSTRKSSNRQKTDVQFRLKQKVGETVLGRRGPDFK